MSVRMNVGIHGEDHIEQARCNTAMHAVHAVPFVVAAKPGILRRYAMCIGREKLCHGSLTERLL